MSHHVTSFAFGVFNSTAVSLNQLIILKDLATGTEAADISASGLPKESHMEVS